jgi:hypothetical protein
VGKLSKANIPTRPKPACKAAQAMLDALDGDDLELLAEELTGGMAMATAWQWCGHLLGDLSPSAAKNHWTDRCSCPDGTPLLGVVRRRG